MSKQRESNIELLRVISIFLVLAGVPVPVSEF
jgi:hypothetical protein